MHRSMIQVYVKRSDKALAFYKKAFDAKVAASYPQPDGTFYHAELDVYGQILALTELNDNEAAPGNTMQFCLHFGQGNEAVVRKIYGVLVEGADIRSPLGPCEFSPMMFGLIDKFGVNWCVFV